MSSAVNQLAPKLLSWASILDSNTREQMEMTAAMPFVYPHVALMPDAHLGKGCAVGSVLPTVGAIIPAAVGVDIGCGMIAVQTQFTRDDFERRGRANYQFLREAIEHAVPVSKGGYNESVWAGHTETRINQLRAEASGLRFSPDDYAGNWELQLGTLGSGNHFIEVSLDEADRVWLFLHSGSRGIGNRIAQFHIKVAQAQCRKRWIDLPHPDLAYLVEGDDEFWAYIRELRWAQKFAYLNREEMMDRVIHCLTDWIGDDVVATREVNCHHNYTTQEKHHGQKVWLSRKGAIDAHEGVWGLIPGSMGTRSYVVTGKGNRSALCSSPHGAGREYSRTAARKAFTEADLEAAMGDIEYRHTDAFIDEIPAAYKDIDIVMRDAFDLVQVEHELRQIINVKGD